MATRKKYNPWTRKFDYVGTGTAVASTLKVYIQPTEPVLVANKSMAIWENSNTNQKLMIYKDSTGNQTLVELT